ncbi:MAG: Nif3-like dinuclear metal center hexameric protein [Victivallales bacterium]|nr:Nif3-like dinuclear metal center hexameric protein [Victivallales bacterium]
MKDVQLRDLVLYLDDLLDLGRFPDDSSNNGLQVEGGRVVRKAVFGVDACLELCGRAAESKADFIFTHHGLSWKSGFKRLQGRAARIFSTLFSNDISLYAAHLPLDAHPKIGHNALIAKNLGLRNPQPFAKFANAEIGFMGELAKPASPADLARIIDKTLRTKCKIFCDSSCEVRKVGVISGGAGVDGIEAAAEAGLDLLVTGEISHSEWHPMHETKLKVIAAGHYRSETPGVLAAMDRVKDSFGIECEFMDIPTGL